jgi:hypothetical protein
VASGRLRQTAVWALAATSVYAVVSVLAGGSYWSHYLVELVVPTAVLAGLVAARTPVARRALVVLVAVSLTAWWVARPDGATTVGSTVGRSVAAVARPDDSIVTVYGHADVTQASGLPSPYPYLWSLPVKTLDPGLRRLDAVLRGPAAPTWFVVWSDVTSWGVDSARTSQLLAARYHPVATLLGRTVYLRDGVRRAAPKVGADAASSALWTPHLLGVLRELVA